MLVTNPQLRAQLPDLLNHPWMTRGFDGPPDPHLLRREALRADELDRQVIRGMTGFEFGTEDDIERRLVAILESEAYRRAVHYWENKSDRPQNLGEPVSNLALAVEWDRAGGQGGENKVEAASTPGKDKRFSRFDFYRHKLFSPSTSPPQLSNTSPSDINQRELPHPTRGYHPLISMYYLAREKMERDGYYVTLRNRSLTSILNDDTLLEIFNQCRLQDDELWNHQPRWCKLSHVCRKWRQLIYESTSHLKMQIIITNSKQPLHMLAHLPPLPLVIDYRSTEHAEDNSGILHAIQQRDRIRRVVLQAPHSTLEQLIMTIDELFPILDALSLLSTTNSEGCSEIMLPRTFTSPNLRHLALHSISLPTGLPTLTSAPSLVTLKLTDIRDPGYFTPEQLLTQLQHIPHLRELSIGFFVTLPNASADEELLHGPMTSTTLPALKWLAFRGESAYLESLVARITAPLLERFNITLFYDLIFTLPHLFEFIEKTEGFRHPVANIIFNKEAVAFVIGPRDQFNDGIFSLHISCKPFDWQIDSATQVCSSLAPVLSVVEELTLECDEQSLQEDWRNDSEIGGIEAWHGILWPFAGVKKLHIGHPLALEFSRALESDNAGLIAEILPDLQELQVIIEAQRAKNAFVSFIDARRDAGRPVHLRVTPFPLTPDESPLIPDEAVDELIDGEDEPNVNADDEDFKPLFLKDLFRYVRFANLVSMLNNR